MFWTRKPKVAPIVRLSLSPSFQIKVLFVYSVLNDLLQCFQVGLNPESDTTN